MFKFKVNNAGNTAAAVNIKDFKIAELLKYLRNFWITLEIPLINCDINLILTWSTWVITDSTGGVKIKITDTKLYVPVVTLSTHDNAKLLNN